MNHLPFILPSFACAICVESFDTLESLSSHIPEHHGNEEFLECPDCAQIFDESSVFTTHFVEHERYRLENKQEDSISIVDNLSNLNDSFDDNIYDGNENDGSISNEEPVIESSIVPEIKTDMTYIKTNKPKPRKGGIASVEWQKHDNKERPFKCDKCDRSFTLASSLKLHDRRHLSKQFNFVAHFLQPNRFILQILNRLNALFVN
jgi:uncharacterized C2H2 Zn-finger protein